MIDGKVTLVETEGDANSFKLWLVDYVTDYNLIAVDTETTGFQWWTPQFTRLVTFSDARYGWAIPVCWYGKLIEWAFDVIVESSTQVIFHNAKFDMHAIRVAGWATPAWRNVHDTALLLHLRRSDMSKALKGRHTADLLGGWVFRGQNTLKEFMKTHRYDWASVPVDAEPYWVYAALDTIITYRLYSALHDTLEQFRPQYDRERRYAEIMYRAEIRGVNLDVTYTERLSEQLHAQAAKEASFLRTHGIDNPNSNQQVVALLEEDFDWVPWDYTDTGQPKLDKKVLARLSQAGGLQGDVIESLVRYKRASKWATAYADQFLANRDRMNRVHPSINTMQARTGRSSVNSPALQTLPAGDPLIRRCLRARGGYAWWSVDYSNQEPRTLAHYGRSEPLLRYFTQGDGQGSIHDFVAAELFGPGYTKTERSIAKAFGLGRSYGAGVATLAVASGLQESEVRAVLPKYDQLMGLEALNKAIEKNCAGRDPAPFVVTHGGRRVFAHPDKLYTLVNFLMQGSGADMTKDAAIRLDEHGYGDNILLPVHDEICFEIPRDEPDMVRDIAKVMQDDTYAVPMPTDVSGPGNSWGDLYD